MNPQDHPLGLRLPLYIGTFPRLHGSPTPSFCFHTWALTSTTFLSSIPSSPTAHQRNLNIVELSTTCFLIFPIELLIFFIELFLLLTIFRQGISLSLTRNTLNLAYFLRLSFLDFQNPSRF